jgi:outer membrane lipoprotein SlyB
MIRYLLTGAVALTMMTGATFAQNSYSTTTTETQSNVVDQAPVRPGPDPAKNMVVGGMGGAAVGAAIGCLATLPIGCAPGAAVGAAVGGGSGAVVGVVATPHD